MEQAYKLLTVGEFLDVCPKDQRHYELFDGIIVAMAPPGQAHQIIHMNLASELGAALRAHHPDCRLHAETGIAPSGPEGRDHFEADIAFTSAPADRDLHGIVTEPLLIVEILSPSTERDDIFVKPPPIKASPACASCCTSKARGPSPRSIAGAARAGRRARSTAATPAYTSKRSGSISPSLRSIGVCRAYKPVQG
jgi:hypothetical protein